MDVRIPWLASDVTTDPVARASEMRAAWEAYLNGSGATANVRKAITESWQRCANVGVLAAGVPSPSLLSASDLPDRWQQHPLRATVPLLREWRRSSSI